MHSPSVCLQREVLQSVWSALTHGRCILFTMGPACLIGCLARGSHACLDTRRHTRRDGATDEEEEEEEEEEEDDDDDDVVSYAASPQELGPQPHP